MKRHILKCLGVLLLVVGTVEWGAIQRRLDELLHYDNGGYVRVSIFLGIWLLTLFSLLLGAFHPSRRVRWLLGFSVFFSSFFGFGYESVTGNKVTYDVIETMFHSLHFFSGAVQFYWLGLVYPFVLSLLAFVILVPVPPPYWFGFGQHWVRASAAILIFLPVAVLFALALLRGGYGLDMTPHAYRSTVLTALLGVNRVFAEVPKRSAVHLPRIKTTQRLPNVVLVVDESVRGDFLDINDNKGITPVLYAMKDRLINFGLASSSANCSYESNQVLRKGPDPERIVETLEINPYLFAYAKQAGYQTFLLDAQAPVGQIASSNGVSSDEQAYIDTVQYYDKPYQEDLDLARDIQRILQQAQQPVFLYVVKKGVHFPYESAVPYALPASVVQGDQKQVLTNKYQFAIQSVVDPFFAALFGQGNYQETVLIYTSDHGQNLMDNGKTMTHCGDSDADWREGIVPLWVVTENAPLKSAFQKVVVQSQDKASHFNIFPTLLRLMGYEENPVRAMYGESLFDPLTGNGQRFFSGSFAVGRISLGERTALRFHTFPPGFRDNLVQRGQP